MPVFLPSLRPFVDSTHARRAVEVVLALLVGVQLVRAVMALAATPAPVSPARMPALPATQPLAGDPFFPQSAAPSASGATPASLTLHAINAGAQGSAILADAGGVQRAYRIGDGVPGGGVLREVRPGMVVIEGAGGRREIALSSAAAAAPSPAVPASPAAPASSAGAQLLQQIGLRPREDGGRHAGFEVLARGDAAALRAAGLEPGDVVQAIDGQPLTPDRLPTLEQALLSQGQANLTVLRDGAARQITVQARSP